MENTFIIGEIVKPQGIKGELKVKPLTDDINRFNKLKTVLIDQNTYRIANVKIAGDTVIVSILGITDRNTAESFRGKFLRVNREDAIPLKTNSFYIADLIGCKLFADSNYIGDIIDITNAKTDYFTVKTISGKIMRFPFLATLNPLFDSENKSFFVQQDKLMEICVYED